MPREVLQVRQAIKAEFDGLIDMSDDKGPPDQVEQHFLSRALAALVARRLLDCESQTAADTLVDGQQDIGIDAIAIAPSGTHMWLIQSKWSDKGRAGFGEGDTRLFREALTYLDNQSFDRFNTKIQDREELLRSAWSNPQVKVTLVIAVMGDSPLHHQVVTRLDDLKKEFGGYEGSLDYELWGGREIWQIIRDDNAGPTVDLVASMDEWLPVIEPFEAYQGRLSAIEVAEWYAKHGDRLFAQNIRNSLGLTRVNQELVDTLLTNPSDFWYYNNGITVLCDSVIRRQQTRGTARGPIELSLSGASVVNGAQTVAAIAKAIERDPDQAGQAYVSVKVVTTRDTPTDFGVLVTKATNTQNHVEARDFAALDPTQWELKEEFTLTLHKEYVYKRGELEPDPELGCSVTNAVLALACANANPELAVRAKNNRDALWETGSAGAYDILFHKSPPTAVQIWRSFQVFRRVQATLAEDKDERGNRANAIASYGEYLIAHIVFRQLALAHIDDLAYPWDEVELAKVPQLTLGALNWLITYVHQEFGPGSFIKNTFTNPERYLGLIGLVLTSMAAGDSAPILPSEYAPKPKVRRQNAVPTIIDAGRIPEGTLLTFKTKAAKERQAVDPWLTADAKRAQATWVNHRSAPLLWAYDGQRYSPTGLVHAIWSEAGWSKANSPIQGTLQWYVPGDGSLADIAQAIQDDLEEDDEQ